jgi:hypothetical protein
MAVESITIIVITVKNILCIYKMSSGKKTIKNPKTGKMVLKDGKIGRQIVRMASITKVLEAKKDAPQQQVSILVYYDMGDAAWPNSALNIKLLKSWWWVGSGTNVTKRQGEYKHDIQWQGNISNKDAMSKKIQLKFQKLKDSGYVKRFKMSEVQI